MNRITGYKPIFKSQPILVALPKYRAAIQYTKKKNLSPTKGAGNINSEDIVHEYPTINITAHDQGLSFKA
jgi:hypothetical protein